MKNVQGDTEVSADKFIVAVGTDPVRPDFIPFDEDSAFRQTPRLLDAIDSVCSGVYVR